MAAIMPTKTGVLTLCRGDLRGSARLPGLVPTGRFDATLAGMEQFIAVSICIRTFPTKMAEPHSSGDLVCRCCAVLRRIHYRDVDNPRCYMSDEILRDVDMYAKSNVRVERPRLPNPVRQERLPQTDLATHR